MKTCMRTVGRFLPAILALSVCACGSGDSVESSVATGEPANDSVEFSGATGEPANGGSPAPVIESLRLEPAEPVMGDTVRALVEIADADEGRAHVRYRWTLGGEAVEGDIPSLSLGDAPRGTTFAITVVASDGGTESALLSAEGVIRNTPPRVERLRVGPAPEFTVGDMAWVEAETSDRDGDDLELEYRWTVNGWDESERANGAEFDTSGLKVGDVLQVTTIADDGYAKSEPFPSPPLRVVNRPPHVLSRPGSSERGRFHYRVEVDDPDGDSVLYSLSEAPEGMQIDSESGVIEWTLPTRQAGPYAVRVLVDDQRGGKVAHSFNLGSAPPAAHARGAY